MARPYHQSHDVMVKAQTVIEFALQNLKLFSILKSVTLVRERNEIESLYKDLKFLEDFIKMGLECSNRHQSFSDLVEEILEVVDEILVVTDSSFYSNLSDTSRFLRYSSRVAVVVQKIRSKEAKMSYCSEDQTSQVEQIFVRNIVVVDNGSYIQELPGVRLSASIGELVQELRRIQPTIFDKPCAISNSGYYSNLCSVRPAVGYSTRVADLVQKIRSIAEKICANPDTEGGSLVVTGSGFYCNLSNATASLGDVRIVADLDEKIRSIKAKMFYCSEDQTSQVQQIFAGKIVVVHNGSYVQELPGVRLSHTIGKLVQELRCIQPTIFDKPCAISNSGFYSNLSNAKPALGYSPRVADLVQMIRSIAKKTYANPDTEGGSLVVNASGFYCNLSNATAFLGDVRIVADLDEKIRSKAKMFPDCRKYNIQGDSYPPQSSSAKMFPDCPHYIIQGCTSSSQSSSSQQAATVIAETIVVGFEDETSVLRDRLIRGRMQLEVIPIVGMAGIGKTTLANNLYNDLSVTYHFHIRAWTSISQVYGTRKSLHGILSSILNENDPVFDMSTEDIGEKLYKCLKGNRYLIVMDDIWDTQAWNDLKCYFPDDENGSRILMTTRIVDAVAKASPDSTPHFLRFLTPEESHNLFKHKVFADKSFPEELVYIGEQIVAKCKGLPLAVVVVAGILAQREKTPDWWGQVADNVGSSVNGDFGQIMDILELSYTHLPPQLKSCFLYLGSFPEDYEIPVKGLIRSWIAEGFVEYGDQKDLEDVAESYLINLISRSLVTVAKKSYTGRLKSCYLHDVLREFCFEKANEKKRFVMLSQRKPNPTPLLKPDLDHSNDNPYRVQSFADCQYFHMHKGCYVTQNCVSKKETLAVYRLLKVLDLRHILLDKFPEKILELVHLRLLALWVDRYQNLPQAIFKLWNLETFILDGDKAGRIELPSQLLKMVRLRHVKISKEILCHEWCWGSTERTIYLPNFPSSVLENLQTLYQVSPLGSFHILLSKTPNLKKLGVLLTFSNNENPSFFSDLPHLDKLETLRFEYQTLGMVPFHLPQSLPPSLKKLTLVGSHVKWEEMSIIGLLPNLEVLKIKDNFFSGTKWETSENSFCSLKFLKLSHIDLEEWISDYSHFPKLEHLVLNGCIDLQEISSDIGEIATLHTIEVYRSSSPAVEWAKEIQENQCHVKILIYQHFQEF